MPSCALSSEELRVPERYLDLDAVEQSALLRARAPELGRVPDVLEKDIWVCWTLQQLFSMPGRLPMAFKGGTSLSKVFGVIERFSEDIDITLDYRGLSAGVDPFAEGMTGRQRRKLSDELKGFVKAHVTDVVQPWLSQQLREQLPGEGYALELSDDGEQLRLYYPSALTERDSYLRDSVLLEFGGRNIIEPNEIHVVRPDIAVGLAELLFPKAEVSVLSPARTFWEKATLMHVECHRDSLRQSAERLSRHWYDLFMLTRCDIGQQAVTQRDLLADVVKHKQVFYAASFAHYEDCLIGKLRLIPDEATLIALADDYRRMVDAGMFIGQPPSFADIVTELRTLELAINRLA